MSSVHRMPIPVAMPTSPGKGGASPHGMPDEEEALGSWLSQFNARIKQKEADRDKKALAASALAGQQITELHERRTKELQLEALRQQEEYELALQNAEIIAVQEENSTRVANLTADLTDDQRVQWLEDDEQISRLERELQDRTGRMDQAGVEARAWMKGYEARQKAVQEAVEEEERQAEEAVNHFVGELRKELEEVEEEWFSGRGLMISEEEEPQWVELLDLAALEYHSALSEARLHCYNNLPELQKTILDEMEPAKRTATLDDLREMHTLTQGLKRHHANPSTRAIKAAAAEAASRPTYLWDAVRVDASPECVAAAALARERTAGNNSSGIVDSSGAADPLVAGEQADRPQPADDDPLASTTGSLAYSGSSVYSGLKGANSTTPGQGQQPSRLDELQHRLMALQGVLRPNPGEGNHHNQGGGGMTSPISSSHHVPESPRVMKEKVALLEELVVEQARQLAQLQQQ